MSPQFLLDDNGAVRACYETIHELRRAHPNISLADDPDAEFLAALGLMPGTVNRPFLTELQRHGRPVDVIDGASVTRTYPIEMRDAGEIEADLTAALERHYDAVAKARRYDSRYTCALRAGYPGPFQAEGQAFAGWMDGCNALAYQIMADVMSGARNCPTSADLIGEMPAMVWPA